jgi:hypothetical protein
VIHKKKKLEAKHAIGYCILSEAPEQAFNNWVQRWMRRVHFQETKVTGQMS